MALLTGFPAMGLLMSGPWDLLSSFPNVLAFFLLFLSIYQLNAYFGYAQDLKNYRLKDLSLNSKNFYLKLSLIFLLLALTLLARNGSFAITLGMGIYLVWALYSHPVFGTKNYPLLGNATHFVMGIAHFFLGYLINSTISADSLALAIYFSLLFTGGHLIHELIDVRVDGKNNLKTSATVFGWRKTSWFSQVLFGLSFLYLVLLLKREYLPLSFFIPFSFAYILQLFYFLKLKIYLESDIRILMYRKVYRYLYLIAGMLWVIFNYYGGEK